MLKAAVLISVAAFFTASCNLVFHEPFAKKLFTLTLLFISHIGFGQSFLERGVLYNQGDLKQAERWFDWAIEA